jgi:hypothetical protein
VTTNAQSEQSDSGGPSARSAVEVGAQAASHVLGHRIVRSPMRIRPSETSTSRRSRICPEAGAWNASNARVRASQRLGADRGCPDRESLWVSGVLPRSDRRHHCRPPVHDRLKALTFLGLLADVGYVGLRPSARPLLSAVDVVAAVSRAG